MTDTAIEVTPWFDGEQKPVRVGPYERDYGSRALLDLWDGTQWRQAMGACAQQNRAWRGLAQQPKEIHD